MENCIKQTKTVKGIPKSETIWLTHKTRSGDKYYITAKTNNRDFYFIYKSVDGTAVKLGKNRNPTVLEEKYIPEE